MKEITGRQLTVAALLILGTLVIAATLVASTKEADGAAEEIRTYSQEVAEGEYIVLAWNDLGMHCYNGDFDDIGVLPPYNTLWAQVLKVGDPPTIVTETITVTFHFADNTYSVGKSNFWDESPYNPGVQNAQALFPFLQDPLPSNVGLTGVGLSGNMEAHGDHFEVDGIPLTEYRDSDVATPYPYQLATVIAYDAATGVELARTQPVAPVSTEMHCDSCHHDNGEGNQGISTGVVEQNILEQHDRENWQEYPDGYGDLMDNRPVLCAECHASNALGAPGLPDISSLSNAIHEKHAGEVPDTIEGCYNCHPGPQTQCLRDTMAVDFGMDCVDCHGTMEQVSQNPSPWLDEPRCDNADCHGSAYQQDQPLYRMSTEHGGLYCAACHDSPHAIAPTHEVNDAIKFIDLQGHGGPVDTCTVCHATWPSDAGPHGVSVPAPSGLSFTPDYLKTLNPGEQHVFAHYLLNSGSLTDTFELNFTSSQGWGEMALLSPVSLPPQGSLTVPVTITVPAGDESRGLTEITVVTATSTLAPEVIASVTDRVLVPVSQNYLPLVLRD